MPTEPDVPVASSAIGVDLERLSWIRRLAVDYVVAFNRLAPHFAGDPSSASAWRDAGARVLAHSRPRAELAALLAAQLRRRDAPPEAMAAAAALRDTGAVAIVTGQQAGLFGGPLFTLLKAITAIKLAARVTRDSGARAIPVFWIDAEDHDWEEVRACTVLDAELRPRTLALPGHDAADDRPVAAVALDEGVAALVEELRSVLAPTEFTRALVDGLARAYRPGAGMVDAFARWLDEVLGRLGLVVYDASDQAAKPLVRDIFIRELESPGRTAALAARAGEELVARGYHAQVGPHLDSVAMFYLDGARRPIRRLGDRFTMGDRTRTAAQLIEDVAAAPERFSPNVLLRPVVQDALFPTVCYVAGPSELAYLAQLRAVYDHLGVPMPLIYPRATATLLDSGGMRFLMRYEVPIEDLHPQDEAALNRLLEARLPAGVERALADAEAAVRARMEAVIETVPALDPTLEGAARSTLGRMQHDLEVLRGKIIHAAKRRDDTLRRQFIRTRAQAFPGGHPQERTVAFVYFMNRYGPSLVDRLLAELPLEPARHWALSL